MPLEANLWGTPKSSGSFSTLFRSRILRALDYKQAPFELKLVKSLNGRLQSEKVFGTSNSVDRSIAGSYEEFAASDTVYLSCGDSANTDIPDHSVDLVITDPPFFDNVHYSQLADFFYVWLRQMLGQDGYFEHPTTRARQEVQDTRVDRFASKLTAVFGECHRVLGDAGLLVFTYHHSRIEGWASVYKAIRESGFYITHTHPVKAEMAVSVPIKQSTVPVHFDLIIVCRKAPPCTSQLEHDGISLLTCLGETQDIIRRLDSSIKVGLGDVKVILMGCVLSRLAAINDLSAEISTIYKLERETDLLAAEIVDNILTAKPARKGK
jgi:adenine-specific DNA methylase